MSSTAHPALPISAPDESALPDVVGLITVCAWCGRPMGRGLSTRRIVSHGICRSCSHDVLFSDTQEAVTRR